MMPPWLFDFQHCLLQPPLETPDRLVWNRFIVTAQDHPQKLLLCVWDHHQLVFQHTFPVSAPTSLLDFVKEKFGPRRYQITRALEHIALRLGIEHTLLPAIIVCVFTDHLEVHDRTWRSFCQPLPKAFERFGQGLFLEQQTEHLWRWNTIGIWDAQLPATQHERLEILQNTPKNLHFLETLYAPRP